MEQWPPSQMKTFVVGCRFCIFEDLYKSEIGLSAAESHMFLIASFSQVFSGVSQLCSARKNKDL